MACICQGRSPTLPPMGQELEGLVRKPPRGLYQWVGWGNLQITQGMQHPPTHAEAKTRGRLCLIRVQHTLAQVRSRSGNKCGKLGDFSYQAAALTGKHKSQGQEQPRLGYSTGPVCSTHWQRQEPLWGAGQVETSCQFTWDTASVGQVAPTNIIMGLGEDRLGVPTGKYHGGEGHARVGCSTHWHVQDLGLGVSLVGSRLLGHCSHWLA